MAEVLSGSAVFAQELSSGADRRRSRMSASVDGFRYAANIQRFHDGILATSPIA